MTTRHPRARAHYADVNGLRVYYEDYGQRIPLLLVHAGSVTSTSWKRWIPRWAEQYRVIVPDSRGHGKTVDPTGSMRVDLMAEDVAALVTALDLERPLLVGWSDGGHIVLEVAMRRSVAVRAVVAGGLEVTAERAREHVRARPPRSAWLRSRCRSSSSREIAMMAPRSRK